MNKIRNRVLASLLVLMMTFSILPGNLSSMTVYGAENIAEGITYIVDGQLKYYLPSGEAAGYYEIYSVEDLNVLAKVVSGDSDLSVTVSIGDSVAASTINVIPDQNARLMNDITDAGRLTAIGSSSKRYTGCFEGNGYTISGITGYEGVALFGYVAKGASVKNLTLDITAEEEDYNDNGYRYGILVNVNYGTVSGCSTRGSVEAGYINNTTTLSGYVAGIVCNNYGSINNCTNEAAFTAANLPSVYDSSAGKYTSSYKLYFGGVCAYNNSGYSVDNCTNKGSITVSQCGHGYAAGIVGYARGNVTNCTNSGTICVNDSSYSSKAGVVGYMLGADGANISLANCVNTGVNESDTNVSAGIVGYVKYADITNCYNLASINGAKFTAGIAAAPDYCNITDCVNQADILGTNYVAGIAGKTTYSTITHCLNQGDITGSGQYHAGGIAGYAQYDMTLQYCSNVGNVSGTSYIGGIVGFFSSSKAISYCYNSGSVAATGCYGDFHGARSGGIAGVVENSEKVEYCYNTGSVISTGGWGTAGIVGVGNYSSVSNYSGWLIDHCYNVGNITGYNVTLNHLNYNTDICYGYRTGEILGGIYSNSTGTYDITNCYAGGNLDADPEMGSSSNSFLGKYVGCNDYSYGGNNNTNHVAVVTDSFTTLPELTDIPLATRSTTIEKWLDPTGDSSDQATEIGNADVMDITAPMAGEPLDVLGSCSNIGVNSIQSVEYYLGDTKVTDITAGYNTTYTVHVTLDAQENFVFGAQITGTINGNSAVVEHNEDGTITLTYTFPVTGMKTVANIGTDKTVTYDGSPIDITTLFLLDANSGAATYSLTGGTGTGILGSDNRLTVTAAGTFVLKVDTAVNGDFGTGTATATLTVSIATAPPEETPEAPDTTTPEETPEAPDTTTPEETPEAPDTTTPEKTPAAPDTTAPEKTPNPSTSKTTSSTTKTTTVSKATLEKNALVLNGGLKVSQTKSKITVKWGKVTGADGYSVYVQYCGKKFTSKSLYSVKSGKTTKLVVKKVNGKKLNLKKNYKIYVVAYKLVNGKKVTLGKTITGHIVGRKNITYTNVKSIKLKKSSYSLKVGKTATVKATTVLVSKSKKQLSNKHAKQFRYASSNKKVATVSAKGKIKAVGKGSCIIYVYARNGYAKKVKVKVS